MKLKKFTILFFIVFTSLLFADGAGDTLMTAAVQMEVSLGTYASEEAFRQAVEEPLARAVEAGAELVIFPEYLGVFYPLIDYADLIGGVGESGGILAVLGALAAEAGRPVYPHELFLRGGPAVERGKKLWGDLARKYGVTLIGGSFFVPHPRGNGTTELRNRTFVFSPDGSILYRQDKVFPTDYETQIVGLSPGDITEAVGFDLKGRRVVLTICRDTYFTPWVGKYGGSADLWIDIKANGEVFNDDQERSFARALPARLAESGVPRGITVCLTGSYMELFWEGRSSFIKGDGGRVTTLAETTSIDSYELLIEEISWD